MIDKNCSYCMEGELVAKFGIKICELNASKVYLFKEQSHKGRVIVASKHHVSEMTELSEEERNAFLQMLIMLLRRFTKHFHQIRLIMVHTVILGIIFIFIWYLSIKKMNLNGAVRLLWTPREKHCLKQNMRKLFQN